MKLRKLSILFVSSSFIRSKQANCKMSNSRVNTYVSRLNQSLLARLWLFCSINPSFDDAKAHHFGNSSTKISPQSVQDNSYDSDGSKLNALLNVSWNKNLCLQANFKNPSVNLWGFSAQGKEKINRLRPENTAHKSISSIIAYCIKSRHI